MPDNRRTLFHVLPSYLYKFVPVWYSTEIIVQGNREIKIYTDYDHTLVLTGDIVKCAQC